MRLEFRFWKAPRILSYPYISFNLSSVQRIPGSYRIRIKTIKFKENEGP